MHDIYPVLTIILPVAAGIALLFGFWLDLVLDAFGSRHYRWGMINLAMPPAVVIYFFRNIRHHQVKGRLLALGMTLMIAAYTAFWYNPFRIVQIYP